MKNLKTTSLVFHAWANRAYPEAKSNSVSYQGENLYSYKACIAKLHGSDIVIFADRTWTVTTSSHQSDARQATSHMKRVYCHDPEASPARNKDWIENRIARLLLSIPTPVMTKKGHEAVNSVKARERTQACALSLANQFNDYLKVVGGTDPIDTTNLEQYRILLERRNAEQLAAQEAARKAAALQATERLEMWRKRDVNVRTSGLHVLPCALRLSVDGTKIETSHGAEIPVDDATTFWPIIKRVKRDGEDRQPANVMLGHYRLNLIRGDGSIKVGCHNIAYSELEAMAKLLGLKL